jgi:hypothetical protein
MDPEGLCLCSQKSAMGLIIYDLSILWALFSLFFKTDFYILWLSVVVSSQVI